MSALAAAVAAPPPSYAFGFHNSLPSPETTISSATPVVEIPDWSTALSSTLYRIDGWGEPYFECYVFLIEILCSAKDLEKVRSVFEEFKGKGLLLNSIAANSLIRSLGNSGMVEEL